MGIGVNGKYSAGAEEMRTVTSERRRTKRGLNAEGAEVGAQRTLRREEWLRYDSVECA
jgi:hypothetical protein